MLLTLLLLVLLPLNNLVQDNDGDHHDGKAWRMCVADSAAAGCAPLQMMIIIMKMIMMILFKIMMTIMMINMKEITCEAE